MQDKDGNTELHLAVRKRSMKMFCSLLGNKHVDLNLINEKGETPPDITCENIPGGLYYNQVIHTSFYLYSKHHDHGGA